MSLNKINRVRVIRYLYNVESGEMDKYVQIYDWYRDLNNYYGIRYRVNTENHSVIIFSPVNRSQIFQWKLTNSRQYGIL